MSVPNDVLEFGTVSFTIPRYMLYFNKELKKYEVINSLDDEGNLTIINGQPSINFIQSDDPVADDNDDLYNPRLYDVGKLLNYKQYKIDLIKDEETKKNKEKEKENEYIKKSEQERENLKMESLKKLSEREEQLKIYKELEVEPEPPTGIKDLDTLINRIMKEYSVFNDPEYNKYVHIYEYLSLNRRLFNIPFNKLPKKQQAYFIIKYP